jgi:MFS superfamily sulfate permease-like transporter
MLVIPKGTGNRFEQQWSTITHVGDANGWTVAFVAGTLIIILGFKRFIPTVPGAVVAVILSIILSSLLDASSHGVAVIGSVQGFPPIGLPEGILSGANFAAGLSGTFVVNGSPTKTQILDDQQGRTQVANLTMSLVVLVVGLFLTGILTDIPKAVLAAIVFLIGVGLIDIKGLRQIQAARLSEFVIAAVTAVVVFAVGVEQGIILAIVVSILEVIQRAYTPKDFPVGVDREGETVYDDAEPGHQSLPGLLVFRFDARLFFANANRFSDPVQSLMAAAPTKVRWLVLDCSSLDDVDYSASLTLAGLIHALHADGGVFAIAGADPGLLATLEKYGTLIDFDNTQIYPTVQAAVAAFRTGPR